MGYYDPLYLPYSKDFSGTNYLLNPHGLINAKVTNKQKAQYIGLASYRNLGQYKLFGTHTLDMHFSPLNYKQIKQNRLLAVRDDQIYFLLEDYTGENK